MNLPVIQRTVVHWLGSGGNHNITLPLILNCKYVLSYVGYLN